MKNNRKIVFLACAASLGLSACSGLKKELGMTRNTPDEFSIVKRAPLVMPPNNEALPVPRPGAPRPQEENTRIQAQKVVFGSNGQTLDDDKSLSPAESALLQEAGAENAAPNIRQTVDSETAQLKPQNIPVAKKLLGIGKNDVQPPAEIVNAKAEAERLRQNQEDGKSVTNGETPTIQQ